MNPEIECSQCERIFNSGKTQAIADGWSFTKNGSAHCPVCRGEKSEKQLKALSLIGTKDENGKIISVGRAAKMFGLPQSTVFKLHKEVDR